MLIKGKHTSVPTIVETYNIMVDDEREVELELTRHFGTNDIIGHSIRFISGRLTMLDGNLLANIANEIGDNKVKQYFRYN